MVEINPSISKYISDEEASRISYNIIRYIHSSYALQNRLNFHIE